MMKIYCEFFSNLNSKIKSSPFHLVSMFSLSTTMRRFQPPIIVGQNSKVIYFLVGFFVCLQFWVLCRIESSNLKPLFHVLEKKMNANLLLASISIVISWIDLRLWFQHQWGACGAILKLNIEILVG